MSTPIDVTGKRFGRLVAEQVANPHPDGRRRWVCRCDCGAVAEVPTHRLRSGLTKSCGCHRRSLLLKHGACRGSTRGPAWSTWAAMRQRCANPKNDRWDRYGGRGIAVCDRWADFSNFLADMGERPSPDHSIHRIDNDGPYHPDNCCWATRKEQAHRGEDHHKAVLSEDDVRSIRSRYGAGGVRQVDLAAEYGISQTHVSDIIRKTSWAHVK